MDANQTRFHLLFGERDWRPVLERASVTGGEPDLAWDAAANAVILSPRLFRFERSPAEAPPSLELRNGAAVDRYGNWYWITDEGDAIMSLSAGLGSPRRFWPVPDGGEPERGPGGFAPVEKAPEPKPVRLRGLAVTEEHYLVAGTLEPPGLVIFDLHAGGPPLWTAWPEEAPFSPYDMARAPGGGIFILDRERKRYWVLDRTFTPLKVDQGTVETAPSRAFHFHPVDGGERPGKPARTFPTGILLGAAAGVEAEDPISIEALPDGSVLILDAAEEGARVHRYYGSRRLGLADLGGVFDGERFEAFDFAFVPDRPQFSDKKAGLHGAGGIWGGRRGELASPGAPGDGVPPGVARAGAAAWIAGTLYIAGGDGNQAFAFSLSAPAAQALKGAAGGVSPGGSGDGPAGGGGTPGGDGGTGDPGGGAPDDARGGLRLELEMRYLPMRSFGGKGFVAVWDQAGGGAAYYDRQERGGFAWVELVEKPRPRFVPQGVLEEVGTPFPPGASSSGDPAGGIPSSGDPGLLFDGKERGCVWHRVMIDAVIPKGAGIAVESRAADDPELLPAVPWRREPDPYLRSSGSELPPHRPFAGRVGRLEGAGTWELLLQEARGRYLQLRIALYSNGRVTPRLVALRVYYPRFSYLEEYLPAVYREDPASRSFLERFLANVEGMFTALEDRIANAQFLFDPRTVPGEYLDWLAGWLGLSLDASWDEDRKRLLLRHAPKMFAERGTPAGIIRAIRLATDPVPTDAIFADPGRCACGVAPGSAGGGIQGAGTAGGAGCACASGGALHPGGAFAAGGVRIVEQFLTRRSPGVVFGDPSQVEGPGVTAPHAPWSPGQGPEPLHEQYRAFLAERYGTVAGLNTAWGTSHASFDSIEFPPVMPAGRAEADDWRRFVSAPIGFAYAPVTRADEGAYRRFLEQRYRRVSAMKAASPYYAAQDVSSFAGVRLPERLPPAGPALVDWIQFASIYLPATQRAHRFTVLVPVFGEASSCSPCSGTGRERRAVGPDPEVVRRVVELEKPAHTLFEIKPYWALFRVGEARLGIDTHPGRSSRLAAAIVGQGALGEQYLAYGHPWSVRERTVVGRDRIGDRSAGRIA